jgi:hypothetical protein
MKQVTRRYSNEVIFEYEGDLKVAVEDWVKNRNSLTNADMRYANMIYANMTSADMTNADMRDANMTNANMTNADMRYANMTNAYGSDISGRIASMQFEKYRLVMLDKEILWGGCTKKTCAEWIEYDGAELNEYDKNYLEAITKPFILMFRTDLRK